MRERNFYNDFRFILRHLNKNTFTHTLTIHITYGPEVNATDKACFSSCLLKGQTRLRLRM